MRAIQLFTDRERQLENEILIEKIERDRRAVNPIIRELESMDFEPTLPDELFTFSGGDEGGISSSLFYTNDYRGIPITKRPTKPESTLRILKDIPFDPNSILQIDSNGFERIPCSQLLNISPLQVAQDSLFLLEEPIRFQEWTSRFGRQKIKAPPSLFEVSPCHTQKYFNKHFAHAHDTKFKPTRIGRTHREIHLQTAAKFLYNYAKSLNTDPVLISKPTLAVMKSWIHMWCKNTVRLDPNSSPTFYESAILPLESELNTGNIQQSIYQTIVEFFSRRSVQPFSPPDAYCALLTLPDIPRYHPLYDQYSQMIKRFCEIVDASEPDLSKGFSISAERTFESNQNVGASTAPDHATSERVAHHQGSNYPHANRDEQHQPPVKRKSNQNADLIDRITTLCKKWSKDRDVLSRLPKQYTMQEWQQWFKQLNEGALNFEQVTALYEILADVALNDKKAISQIDATLANGSFDEKEEKADLSATEAELESKIEKMEKQRKQLVQIAERLSTVEPEEQPNVLQAIIQNTQEQSTLHLPPNITQALVSGTGNQGVSVVNNVKVVIERIDQSIAQNKSLLQSQQSTRSQRINRPNFVQLGNDAMVQRTEVPQSYEGDETYLMNSQLHRKERPNNSIHLESQLIQLLPEDAAKEVAIKFIGAYLKSIDSFSSHLSDLLNMGLVLSAAPSASGSSVATFAREMDKIYPEIIRFIHYVSLLESRVTPFLKQIQEISYLYRQAIVVPNSIIDEHIYSFETTPREFLFWVIVPISYLFEYVMMLQFYTNILQLPFGATMETSALKFLGGYKNGLQPNMNQTLFINGVTNKAIDEQIFAILQNIVVLKKTEFELLIYNVLKVPFKHNFTYLGGINVGFGSVQLQGQQVIPELEWLEVAEFVLRIIPVREYQEIINVITQAIIQLQDASNEQYANEQVQERLESQAQRATRNIPMRNLLTDQTNYEILYEMGVEVARTFYAMSCQHLQYVVDLQILFQNASFAVFQGFEDKMLEIKQNVGAVYWREEWDPEQYTPEGYEDDTTQEASSSASSSGVQSSSGGDGSQEEYDDDEENEYEDDE